jgi:hypothetical protein
MADIDIVRRVRRYEDGSWRVGNKVYAFNENQRMSWYERLMIRGLGRGGKRAVHIAVLS